MATRVWKGFLNFGLLSIPVYLNTAARNKRVDLNTFHVACNSQIKQPKWCPKCEVHLQDGETFRGYKVSDTKVVRLEDEEMEAITPATEHTMEIAECVLAKEVDPIYMAESFYLLPDDAGRKAYSLLVKTLADTGRVAIAQICKSSREHMALIRPRGNGLILNYIWYENEIAKVPEFESLQSMDLSASEIKLAKQLMESLASEFTPSQYEDGYNQRLNTLISSKLDKTVSAPAPVNVPARAATVDIASALAASLNTPKRKITPQDAEVNEGQVLPAVGIGRIKKPKGKGGRKAA